MACLGVQAAVLALQAVPARAGEIAPPDVYQSVMVIQGELEHLRRASGKARDTRPAITVRDAAPREVFFQAITLWVKADRLCNEHRRGGAHYAIRIEIAPPRSVSPRDVWKLTQNTRGRLSCVRRVLDLDFDVAPPPRDATKTPSDVFRAIAQANRQINLLLRHPFAPGDVFAMVMLAEDYLGETLDRLTPGWRTQAPRPVAPVAAKSQADVLRELTRCFAIARRIARKSGLEMIVFKPDFSHGVEASDAFDMAALVFSEVRYFAAKAGIAKRFKIRPRTTKTTADVHARVLLLKRLLGRFEKHAETHAGWHAAGSG